jgi:polyhydroxybutyrate depolymerase
MQEGASRQGFRPRTAKLFGWVLMLGMLVLPLFLTMSRSASSAETDARPATSMNTPLAPSAPTPVPLQAHHPTGDFVGSLSFRNHIRKYDVHVPPSYKGGEPWPMVVCFHGGGGDIGFARRMFRLNEKADKEHFLVCYPNGSGRLRDHVLTWNAIDCCGYAKSHNIDDIAFCRMLLARLSRDYEVDQRRVYLLGFSNGAMFAYRLATEMPEKFAAFAIVSGSMCGKEPQPSTPISALIMHGTADKHIPVEGGPGKLAKWGFDVHAQPLSYPVSFWVKADGCNPTPQVVKTHEVECKTFTGGKEGSEVILYTIDGYAHSWPGGKRAWLFADKPYPSLSATDVCWDFFARHVRNSLKDSDASR